MWDNAMKNYGDSLHYSSDYGRPNIDFVRIDANTIRLYFLQGVERPNIVPFGNDYSIDFDRADIIIDSIFGTGLRRDVDSSISEVIEKINGNK